ncbi:MAG: LytTR family transcriptional regulator DNA-binding domain-containing protein [Bacteroidales bacterium]|jgi:DNA-binding LytR/AlgR family response regulator
MKNDVKIVGSTIFIACEGNEIYRPLNQIYYCEAVCRTCEIVFNTEKPQKAYIGLNKLALLLPKDAFYMCHRFFIIHLGILKEATIHEGKIFFRNYTVPVARERFNEFQYRALAYLAANA